MRDQVKSDWLGKGVTNAVKNVNTHIAEAMTGKDLDIVNQAAVDQMLIDLDGTDNKSKLGANAILGVSMAIARAASAEQNIPLYKHLANLAGKSQVMLPVPAFNVINGGSHAGNKLAMQEFMLLPYGVESFSAAMKCGAEIYQNLKNVIKKKYGQDATNVGAEGGFAPNILANTDALDLVVEAIRLSVSKIHLIKTIGKGTPHSPHPSAPQSKWSATISLSPTQPESKQPSTRKRATPYS